MTTSCLRILSLYWINMTSFLKLTSLIVLLLLPATILADTIEGTVVVSVSSCEHHQPELRYSVVDAQGVRTKLEIGNLQKHQRDALKTGVSVSLFGESNGLSFLAEDLNVLKPAPLKSRSGIIGGTAVTGTRKAAIIIVNFSDGGTVNCSASDLDTLMYTGTPSVRGLYEATSKNLLTWQRDTDGNNAADIFGPYSISSNTGTCDTAIEGWGAAAKTAATNAGVNLSLYNHIAIVVPDTFNCPYGGVADLACGEDCHTVIVECDSMNNWAHELGHNLGMRHSSTDTNNDQSPEDEGGDHSCPMGDGDETVYFNAPQQDLMGWFDTFSGKVQTITQNGTYTISPLSTDPNSTSNPQILKIQVSGDEFYYLSYRQAVGDYNQPKTTYIDKLQVHRFKISERSSGSDNTFLIKSLNDSESFEDSSIGFSVTQNSHDKDGVTMSITVANGETPEPDCSLTLSNSTAVYALWNGFLGMTNILELINPDGNFDNLATTRALVSLYSIDGTCQSQTQVDITEGGQRDLIINSMSGFQSDSYGIIKVEYTNNLSGRLSNYKPAGSEYDFAYSVDLRAPLTGTSTYPYNTYKPGTNITTVNNWLTVVNLDSSAKSFSIESINGFTNEVRLTRTLDNLDSFRRSDLDGGHGVFGADTVGTHRVIPSDNSTPYLALLIRYGETSTSGTFAFAFPITAGSLSGAGGVVPISSQFGETNWVEFSSAGNYTAYGPDGSEIGSQSNFSSHLQASSLLSSGERGVLVSNSSSVLSMFYLKDSQGNVTGVHGVPGRLATNGSTYNGSYNLFLGMNNWLTISNPTSSTIQTSVYRVGSDSSGSKSLSLPAFSTEVIAVHSDSDLSASADTYGLIRVQPASAAPLIVDLLRHREVNNEPDFAFPTEVIRAD